MTYKSTRTYDFRLLERHIDFESLVDNAMAALKEQNEKQYVDGVIGCTLHLVYPDLELVDPTKGGWDARVERLTEKVHRRFSDIDWEITRLKGNLFDVIDLMHDILPHTVTTAVRKNKYQLERAIEVGVPCRVSFASALFVLEVLLKMIIPDWFQYAASAGLSTWIVTTKQPDRTIIKEEVAEKVPWRLWLREDTHL
ncbi:MAG: hypothetical protein ACFFCX_15685, partial [Candidatus Sifarchaeia archaeon]